MINTIPKSKVQASSTICAQIEEFFKHGGNMQEIKSGVTSGADFSYHNKDSNFRFNTEVKKARDYIEGMK